MKLDILAALVKRFNKIDDKVRSLYESTTDSNAKFLSFRASLNEFSDKAIEDRESKKRFREELRALNRSMKSLSENNKQILLKEVVKPPKGDKGDKGEPGKGIKGDKGDKGDSIKGDDGRGIKKMFINPKKHWIVLYTDGTRVDMGKIVSDEDLYKGGGDGISIYSIQKLLQDYIPYTGATQNVDLGIFNLSTTALTTLGQVTHDLPSAQNILIDGATNERTVTVGAIRHLHTPAITGTRARNLVINTNSQSDTTADVVEYNSFGLVTGDIGHVYKADINTAGSVGGTIVGLGVEQIANGASKVKGLHIGDGVGVLHQNSGTAKSIEQAFIYDGSFTDVTTAFNSTGTDVQMFASDGDIVYIGDDLQFSVAVFLLAVKASNPGVKPTFEFWNGSAWTGFGASDGTNGFRVDGNIRWIASDLTGWATNSVNAVTKYWIRIIRNSNNLSTIPTEDIVTIIAPTIFYWDENGDVVINDLTCRTITGTVKLTHSTKIDDYPLISSDQVVIFNITTSKVATLPDPTGNSGESHAIINKYSSTANLTFSRSINNDSSFALQPGEVINIMSDGTEYLIHQ